METTKQILRELSSDAREGPSVLPLAPDLYPPEAIRAAIDAYSEFCLLERLDRGDGVMGLSVQVRPAFSADARRIFGELLNFLLRAAVEHGHERHAP